MSDLEVFQGHKVRFVGTADKPEWVAADVIAVLYPEAERSSYSKYIENIPSEWKGKKKVLTGLVAGYLISKAIRKNG
jgi:hypothetical protein